MIRRWSQGLLACSLLWLLGACTSLALKPEPPRVTLVGLEVVSVELFEQRYRVQLRVKNPNAFVMPVRGIDFRLQFNGQSFADGVSGQRLDIPAFGERVVELQVSSSLLAILGQIQSLEQGQVPEFDYRISGSVATGDYGYKLPFDYSGRFQLAPPAESDADESGRAL